MKFGKKLRATVNESYEEWRPMFMSYKDLKKTIHPRIHPHHSEPNQLTPNSSSPNDNQSHHQTPDLNNNSLLAAVRHAENEHPEFFTTFKREVDKVNEFFLDKQEDYIIDHQQLSSKVDEFLVPGRATRPEVNRLCQRLTNFHGELVLLENFSSVNYIGFRKILKKHDKKTGLKMQTVYLKTVLTTPFFLSDTLRKLILQTESQLALLDNIRKFRRPNPLSALALEAPIPAPLNLRENSPQDTESSAQTPPVEVSPSPRRILESPRPSACIPATSALWRLHSHARVYARNVREAMSNPQIALPLQPPPSLVTLVDQIRAAELGINEQFVNSIVSPSNYCIAAEKDFTIGFFVIGPETSLQIFKHEGTFITRNLWGKSRVQCFKDQDIRHRVQDASAHLKDDETGTQKRYIEETRNGVTNGPWPALFTCGPSSHAEWKAVGWCVLFYVCMPAFELDVLPRYDVVPVGNSRFQMDISNKRGWSFSRILC